MASVRADPQPRLTRVGSIPLYLARSLSRQERFEHAEVAGAVVLRGEDGAQDARVLRSQGWNGDLWVDPAAYERRHSLDGVTNLLGQDPWLVDQQLAGVKEYISPGSYVGPSDRSGLRDALRREAAWVRHAGGGRISLAIDWRWLTIDLAVMKARLADLDSPVAIALSDRNDPLSHAGAVEGLAELAFNVPNLMVLRCDMGAFGAVSHGATVGAVGTATSVRHVVPPGVPAGGARTGALSIFVDALRDWKLNDWLAALPSPAVPWCYQGCCRGGRLDRFVSRTTAAAARVHNRDTLLIMANQLLALPPSQRPAAFKSSCQNAVAAAANMEMLTGGRQVKVKPQIAAWASL
jgi:hypothetical protein